MGFTSTQLAVASIGLGIVGTGLQAYGAYQQSQAAKQQAEYRAAVSRNNQIVAQREAEDIRERGKVEEQARRRQIAALKGRQRAALAEQGQELGVEGTAEDILVDTALLGELDIETIRANAERAAYGKEVEAANFGTQAGLFDLTAENQSPFLTGTTSLITGAGSVASRWYDWKSTSSGRKRTSIS